MSAGYSPAHKAMWFVLSGYCSNCRASNHIQTHTSPYISLQGSVAVKTERMRDVFSFFLSFCKCNPSLQMLLFKYQAHFYVVVFEHSFFHVRSHLVSYTCASSYILGTECFRKMLYLQHFCEKKKNLVQLIKHLVK